LNGISWLFRSGNPLVVTIMIVAAGALLAGAVKLAARLYKGMRITWSHAVLVVGAILLLEPTCEWLMSVLYERPVWPVRLLLGFVITVPILVWLTGFYLSSPEGEHVEAEQRVIFSGLAYLATAVAVFLVALVLMAMREFLF
jgi:hypothetical protein